ncbi:MAG: hypothetical protein H6852_13240 [Geminicoccaceae bacterium]|jgi:hypothetical protein|nr:hypothetical protein [Geminicoccaceae bacterium]MCB9968584.1 hypothetical protein [Geminicoccaceae bacterium]HRY23530.1 diacylglycerol kinase family protein [Geminicoccaceae bacterium]
MRIGLLSNPGSTRNRVGMAAIEALAERTPEILHRRFEPALGFGPPLQSFAAAGCDLVVVSGGDGTVQGILTELLAHHPFAELPALAILPRGMANMTATDCGLAGHDAATLERLVAACRAGRLADSLVTRHILKADFADGVPAPRGMFMGAAGIIDIILFVTGRLHSRGIKGEWSHAATILGLLGLCLFRGFQALGLRAHRIGLAIDGTARRDEVLAILIATTLDRLVLRSRPYWGAGDLPLRHTRFAHPPRGLVRHAWRLLYGGADRRLPSDSYRSGGGRRLELWLDGPFTIDGEFFTPAPGRPVTVTADETIRFARV